MLAYDLILWMQALDVYDGAPTAGFGQPGAASVATTAFDAQPMSAYAFASSYAHAYYNYASRQLQLQREQKQVDMQWH